MTQLPEALGDVGEGWHPLLMRLHEQLITVRAGYSVDQVKEKYGTLRVYLSGGYSPYLETLVERAERESATICEYCGQPGQIRGDRSWVKTLCEDHK